MQTLFVTGASGFIGGALVHEFVSRGIKCKCLVRPTSNTDAIPTEGVEFVEGAIEEPDSYRAALEGCDAVINSAGMLYALDKARLFLVNSTACGILADACLSVRQPPRLVHLSSMAAAGPPPQGKSVRTESDPPRPISLYGRSKLQGELALIERADNLPITIIRAGFVYGPRDPKLAESIRTIKRWRLHPVVGFRTPPLSLIHVDDLARFILLAAERGETLCADQASSRGIYFACDDSEFPNYWEFGQRIARSLDQRVVVWPLWRWVARCIGFSAQTVSKIRGTRSLLTVDKVREASARSWASSGEKARQQLGFAPAKSLDGHLRETSRWYVENGWV
jgi:nucleoside-diphosphate-sugar epimerase